MSNVPVLDMVFAVIIVLMLIRGYLRGFVEEIFSWVSVLAGILAAAFLHPSAAALVRTKAMGNVRFAPEIIAFVAIFLGIMIFLKMLEQVLKDVVKSAKLGGIDKVIGLVFGIVEGLIITTLLLFVMSVQPLFDVDSFIRDSLFAEILLPLIQIPLERGREAINAAVLIRDKFPAADFMLANLAFAASRPAGVFPPETSGAFPA